MRRAGRFFAWGLAAAGALAGRADVGAAPLDPTSSVFTSHSAGDVTLASGAYGLILGTSTPTLVAYNGPTFTTVATGFVYNGINVFDFHSLNVGGGATIGLSQSGATGPVAFLSSTSLSMGGSIDLSGSLSANPFTAGPGAGTVANGSNGTTGGNQGGIGPGSALASGGGGGGLGGSGQQGGSPAIVNVNDPNHAVVGHLPGGAGGSTYVSLANQLVGGGNGGYGGGFVYGSPTLPNGGGFGGGAIELGAVQGVAVSGTITANGSSGGFGGTAQFYGGGGGGAGGGVFLHATSVSISGTITAIGGAGGAGYYANSNGGAGGGGLVLAEYDGSRGTFSAVGTVNVGSGPTIGRFDVASVPEPASILMLGMAAAGGVGVAGWRRSRSRSGR